MSAFFQSLIALILSRSQGWPGQETVRTAHCVTHHPQSCEWIHEQRQPKEALGALTARMDRHREELCESADCRQCLQRGNGQQLCSYLHVWTPLPTCKSTWNLQGMRTNPDEIEPSYFKSTQWHSYVWSFISTSYIFSSVSAAAVDQRKCHQLCTLHVHLRWDGQDASRLDWQHKAVSGLLRQAGWSFLSESHLHLPQVRSWKHSLILTCKTFWFEP